MSHLNITPTKYNVAFYFSDPTSVKKDQAKKEMKTSTKISHNGEGSQQLNCLNVHSLTLDSLSPLFQNIVIPQITLGAKPKNKTANGLNQNGSDHKYGTKTLNQSRSSGDLRAPGHVGYERNKWGLNPELQDEEMETCSSLHHRHNTMPDLSMVVCL